MKKIQVLLVVLVAFSLILSACQPAAEEPAAEEPAAEKPAAEEPAAEKPAEAKPAAGGEQIVLEFWSMWNEPEPQALAIQKWIAAFEQEHPDIKINATWNGRENQTKIRSAMAAGTVIDFMDQDADQVAGGLVAEGLGYPMDEFLKQKALDEDITVAETFVPGVLDLHKLGDNYFLFPYVYNTWQFWTNMDILAEVGVTQEPQTWTEFLDMAKKIKDAGHVVIAAEGSEFTYNFPYFVYFVERMKGPGFVLAAAEDKTGEAWKDPEFLKAAQMVRELWDLGYIPKESVGYVWPAGQMTLAVGDSTMEMCGSWLPTELRDTAGEDFNWGGLRFPNVEGGKGSIDDVTAWLLSFMIMKDSKHPEQVFEFLKFSQTKANAQIMADEALVGVTRKGVSWPKSLKDGEKASANAKVAFLPNDGIQALYPEYQEKVLKPAYDSFFSLQMTPEEYIEKMAADTKAYWASK